MPYAVELTFDAASERAIAAVWQALADAGLSRSMLGKGYRPHISLGVCDELDVAGLAADLVRLAAGWSAFPVALTHVGHFPGDEGVLYYGLDTPPALVAPHAAFFAVLRRHASGVWEYYRPGLWVPHCTLAYGLAPDQMVAAIAVASQVALPMPCHLVEVILVRTTTTGCDTLWQAALPAPPQDGATVGQS